MFPKYTGGSGLHSLVVVNESTYYVPDYVKLVIAVFNSSWILKSTITYPYNRKPYCMIMIDLDLYTGDSNGILKTDTNLNVLSSYTPTAGGLYYSIYHNQHNKTIIAANRNINRIEIIDLNLNLMGTISVSSSTNEILLGVYMHKNIIYASTKTGKILVTNNVNVVSSFTTACNGNQIFQIYIDPCGLITVPCFDNYYVYFYNINGTKLIQQVSVSSRPNYVGFDYFDKFIIITDKIIYSSG